MSYTMATVPSLKDQNTYGGEGQLIREKENSVFDKIDIDNTDIRLNTKLHIRMREIDFIDSKLSYAKEDYNQRTNLLRAGEHNYVKKEVKTVTDLAKLRVLLNEKELLRVNANKKAVEERNITRQRITLISKAENELLECEEQLSKLRSKLNDHKEYKRYLERVVQYTKDLKGHGESYLEIEDVLRRYDSLNSTFEDLREKSTRANESFRDYQNTVALNLKELQHNWVKLNSDFGVSLKKLEILRNATIQREMTVALEEHTKQHAAETFSCVELAIRNIYTRCLCYPTHSIVKGETVKNPLIINDPRIISLKATKKHMKKKNQNDNHLLNNTVTIDKLTYESGHELVVYLTTLLQNIQHKILDMKDVTEAVHCTVGQTKPMSRVWSLPNISRKQDRQINNNHTQQQSQTLFHSPSLQTISHMKNNNNNINNNNNMMMGRLRKGLSPDKLRKSRMSQSKMDLRNVFVVQDARREVHEMFNIVETDIMSTQRSRLESSEGGDVGIYLPSL